LGSDPTREPTISREEAQAAGVAIAVIVACLATLFPAVVIAGRISEMSSLIGGPLSASLAVAGAAALLILPLSLSRTFRKVYFALLTIGWSFAAYAHIAPSVVCATGTALALLALGSAATAAASRLD
jgi:hypothetical protein